MKKIFFLICTTLCIGAGISKAQYTDLFDFNGINGASPSGALTLSDSVFYGMTNSGGVNNKGTIFSIHTDGTGHTTLLDFNGINGAAPEGSLTLSNGVLYGMTFGGGADSGGVLFSINIDGSGYKTLLDFNGTNGYAPYGSLIISGNVLYGMTSGYNINALISYGNIFSIHINGTGYTNLFDFNGTNGQGPRGDLTLSGNVLYGMTRGGNNIFSINTDGTGFNNLFIFDDPNLKTGRSPYGSLVVSGNVLYGETSSGGIYGSYGTLFSIKTDGSDYKVLHNFNGIDGRMPLGYLTLLGNALYGTAYYGGAHNGGNLFSINTDSTGFTNLFDFNNTNGYNPCGYLTLSGNILYGMTSGGGANNGVGVMFSYNIGVVGVNQIAGKNAEMNVFPNPANTIFTISYQADATSNITLTTTDSNGKLIYTDKQYQFSGAYQKTIDLSAQPKGIYFIEIICGGQTQSKKIVLQ